MNEAIGTVIIALLIINLVGLVVIGSRVSGQTHDSRDLNQRLTFLEARVNNAPTHADLKEISRGLNATAEAVASLGGKTETMTQMLRTVQEHLLDNEGHRR